MNRFTWGVGTKDRSQEQKQKSIKKCPVATQDPPQHKIMLKEFKVGSRVKVTTAVIQPNPSSSD